MHCCCINHPYACCYLCGLDTLAHIGSILANDISLLFVAGFFCSSGPFSQLPCSAPRVLGNFPPAFVTSKSFTMSTKKPKKWHTTTRLKIFSSWVFFFLCSVNFWMSLVIFYYPTLVVLDLNITKWIIWEWPEVFGPILQLSEKEIIHKLEVSRNRASLSMNTDYRGMIRNVCELMEGVHLWTAWPIIDVSNYLSQCSVQKEDRRQTCK